MMKRISYLIAFAGILLLTVQCNSNQNTKEKTFRHYEAEAIGWSFEYPAGWEILAQSKKQDIENQGKQIFEEEYNVNLKLQNKKLLWISKGDRNMFSSVLIPYDAAKDGPFPELIKKVNRVTVHTYKAEEIPFSHHTGEVFIDSLKFQTLTLTVMDQSKTDTLFVQTQYYSLVNDSTLLKFMIKYSSEQNLKELHHIIKSSEFK